MNILIASSEAVPFAKTGGLADVASGLSKALAEIGHEVTLIMPCHRRFIKEEQRGDSIAEIKIDLRNTTFVANIRQTTLPGSHVKVILVDQPQFFDRDALYNEGPTDYPDNAERFIFFSKAVVEYAATLGHPDIIHANDWQTGLIPALVTHERNNGRFLNTGTVLTIHNMAFHGWFPDYQMELTGLPSSYFNWKQMEAWGQLNLLKTGITMADMVTTVSPSYAREICRPEYGYGLDPVLLERGDTLVGILNGVDTQVWNPAVDQKIAANYTADTFQTGKPKCKQALQNEMGLAEDEDAFLLGMVTRLTDQKGLDLIVEKADQILQARVQFAFLGTGDKHHEEALNALRARHPGKVGVYIGFKDDLAHRIEAGSDAYLMPSLFEPCGLNQMYSLIYGTVPIVHAVGGLADSIVDADMTNVQNQTATGFQFFHYDAETFLQTVWTAIGLYQHYRTIWNQIAITGMQRDSSWSSSAAEYVKVYERARGN